MEARLKKRTTFRALMNQISEMRHDRQIQDRQKEV